jgi:Immunity protein 42
MIVGQPSVCAIESEISRAYQRPGVRGLGYFVIHLGGLTYGVKSAEATLLACSFDQVCERIQSRGLHKTTFSQDADAARLADAVTYAIYGGHPERAFDFSTSEEELRCALATSSIVWAPDGDEAFDDSSNVLQFDIGDRVRLIGFKRENGQHNPHSLRDVWLQADVFYGILSRWQSEFLSEWAEAPKQDEDDAR